MLLELFPLVAKKFLTDQKKQRYEQNKPKETPKPVEEKPTSSKVTEPITGTVVSAPMPGRIIQILVKPGDKVQMGQDVVILEAMKMENSITANQAGTIKQVLVNEGEAVAVDAPLVEIA